MMGIGVEYVYSELQVVDSVCSPGNDRMVGCHAVAIRFDLGGQRRSQPLVLDMTAAQNLLNDLQRVFREYQDVIEAAEDGSNQEFPGGDDAPGPG